MSRVMRFPGSVKRDPAIDIWMREHSGDLGAIAQRWFEVMRDCGDDIRELLHDGHPTACVGDAAFAYVNAFTAHVNVGFFLGAFGRHRQVHASCETQAWQRSRFHGSEEAHRNCLHRYAEAAASWQLIGCRVVSLAEFGCYTRSSRGVADGATC